MQFHDCRFLHACSAEQLPLVAISACLTGAAVRYDGADKYQPGVDSWLRNGATLLPICPEVDAGLSVPRPPVQLVRIGNDTRALGRDDLSLDVTDALQRAAQRHCTTLLELPLCGYLWKSRSPSCGLGSTPLLDEQGLTLGAGYGIQAEAIARSLPWLAMAEEAALRDEQQMWRFLFCCRLVFDCLYAGTATAAQLIAHYEMLLIDIDGDDHAALTAALLRNDLRAAVALLVRSSMSLPAATLRRRVHT